MTAPRAHYSPLSRTLIRRIALLAGLCMLVMGGIKATLAYREVQRDFDHAVQTVAENSLRLLSTALWDIEVGAVRQQVNWLATLPEVGRVRVQAVTGQVFAAGNARHADRDDATALDITAPNGSSKLGRLEIWPNHDLYAGQMIRAVVTVIFEYLVFTLLICLSVNWILRRELQHPLQQIARFASSLKPNELTQPLTITRRKPEHTDEIDLVVSGFQRLQADLRHHIETLDQTVEERTRQLNDVVNQIQRLSVTDPLTGCYNRRWLDEHLPAEIERCFRYDRPLSVVFVDIDHFKSVNDDWGHAAGDAVLHEIVSRFQQAIRTQIDCIARYGGEEFLIMLPERRLEEARQVAERLRGMIKDAPVQVEAGNIAVTASFGVTEYASGDSAAALLARADDMLYKAKGQGRNRVLVA